jgi:hypothetical protein
MTIPLVQDEVETSTVKSIKQQEASSSSLKYSQAASSKSGEKGK